MKTLLPAAILFCGLINSVNYASAQIWKSNGIPGVTGWSSIALSADGNKMAATSQNPTYTIYISTNSGTTWLPTNATNQYWTSIASSANGNKLIAAAAAEGIFSGGVYTSTNFGITWASNNVPNPNYWNSVASSENGVKLIAAAGNYSGPIYISTNSGNSWTKSDAPIANWISVASSGDGSKLLAGTFEASVYFSTNSGSTWTPQVRLAAARWTKMVVSADGKILIAVAYEVGSEFGRIYLSTNSGNSWIQANAPTNYDWPAFCASADGTKLAAIGYYSIFYSADSGNTWTSNSIPEKGVKGVVAASSADGNKLALIGLAPGIYTTYSIPTPQLNLTTSNTNLAVSWLIPSTNFVLQQSSDLISWSNITNTPSLNLTNLNNELCLLPTNNSGFFRLISQ